LAGASPEEKILAGGFASRTRRVLEHRRAPLFAALLAFVLMLPALRTGSVGDDYFHRMVLLRLGEWGAATNPVWDLFSFAPTRLIPWIVNTGYLPWWMDPGINISPARPLTALTHVLDYALWPNLYALPTQVGVSKKNKNVKVHKLGLRPEAFFTTLMRLASVN
jgi:hypothetical protein